MSHRRDIERPRTRGLLLRTISTYVGRGKISIEIMCTQKETRADEEVTKVITRAVSIETGSRMRSLRVTATAELFRTTTTIVATTLRATNSRKKEVAAKRGSSKDITPAVKKEKRENKWVEGTRTTKAM